MSGSVGTTVELLTGSATTLPSLLDDWDRLQRSSPTSSPFQSAGWVNAHWSAHGTQDARVVTLRECGELTAAGAFRSRRVGPATVLTAAPPQLSDFTDVVLSQRDSTPAQLVAGLMSTPGWDVLDFPEVPPSADLWRLLPSWPGRVLRFPASQCVVLDGHSLEDYASRLPRSKRKQLLQQQRGIVRAGVTTVRTDGADAVKGLLALHRESWADRDITPEHLTSRFEQLLVDALQAMAPRHQATVLEFHQGGRSRGAALYVCGPRQVGIYLTGHSADLREQVNLNVLEVAAGFELMAERGLGELSLLRGLEPYKLTLPARREANERVVLIRPGSAAGRLVGAGVVGRRRAAGAVRSGRRRLAAWTSARRSP
jgi:CelD/BcsL family acetyltransferase involved in cellulose biosynthesis